MIFSPLPVGDLLRPGTGALRGHGLPRVAQPIFAMSLGRHYRKDDVITMLLEFEHQLNSPKLVRNAKINCGSGTEEVHGSRTLPSPGIDIFEVKSGFFLLKKYSHTLRHTLRSLRFAPANYRRINYTCPNQKQAGLRDELYPNPPITQLISGSIFVRLQPLAQALYETDYVANPFAL
jgi:hypothetical protein